MTTEEQITSLELSINNLQGYVTNLENTIKKLSQQVSKNSSLNGNSSTTGDSLNLNGDLSAVNAKFTGNEEVDGQSVSGSIHTGDVQAHDINANEVTGQTVTGTDVHATTGTAQNMNVTDTLITKDLSVTGAAHFVELIIDKVRSAGGTIVLSAASAKVFSVTEETDDWKLSFLKKDSEGLTADNDFIVGDQVLCQSFSGQSGSNVSNKYYYSTVTASGTDDNYHYIKISKTDVGTGTVLNPEAGDAIVQLGYNEQYMTAHSLALPSDVKRREAAIIMSSYTTIDAGIYPPSIVQYHNIKNFVSLSKCRLDYTSAGVDGNGENSYSGTMKVKNDNTYIDLLDYISGKIPSQGTMYTAYAVDSNDSSAGWYIQGYGTPDTTKTYRYIGYVLTTKSEPSLIFTDFTGWSRIDSTEYYKLDVLGSSCLVSTEGKISMSASYSVLHVNGTLSGMIKFTDTSAFKIYLNGTTLLVPGTDYTVTLSSSDNVITFTIVNKDYNDTMSYYMIKNSDYNISDQIDIKYSKGYIQHTTDDEFLSYYQGSKTVSATYTDGYGVTQTYNVNLSTFFKQTSDALQEHATAISKNEHDVTDAKTTADGVKLSISSWRVSGQNRLYNTGFIKTDQTTEYWKAIGTGGMSLSSVDGIEWMAISGSAAGDGIEQSTNDRYGSYAANDMTGNEQYTFSGLIKGSGTVNIVIQYLSSSGTVLGAYTKSFDAQTVQRQITFTFNATTGAYATDIDIYGFNFIVSYVSGTAAYAVSIARPQLESGTVVTKWTENNEYLKVVTQALITASASDISMKLNETGIDIKDKKISLTADNVTFSNNVQVKGNIAATTFATVNNTFTVDASGNVVCTGGTFTNATVTGTITATGGKIAGFQIQGNDLTNDPFDNDASIIFRHDSVKCFAAIGGNVLPPSSGMRAVARFENCDNTNFYGVNRNIAMIIEAQNSDNNLAFIGHGSGYLNGAIDGYELNEWTPSDSDNVITLNKGNKILIKGSYPVAYLPNLSSVKDVIRNYTESFAILLRVIRNPGGEVTVFGYRDGSHGDTDCPHMIDQNASEVTGGINMQEGDSLEFLLCYQNSSISAGGTPDTYRAYILNRHN